jgi:hypothetical protein
LLVFWQTGLRVRGIITAVHQGSLISLTERKAAADIALTAEDSNIKILFL